MYISLKRTLAPQHPLHEMISAHFWYTLVVNDAARKKMIQGPDGAVPRIMSMGWGGLYPLLKKGWDNFSMETYDPSKGFKERQVEDLPKYYYRDDSLAVWNSINSYCRKTVSYFYGNSDEAVQQDTELQDFVKELHGDGHFGDKGTPFVGGKASTLEQVIDFCTKVIWACSGYHAALNNGQFDYYGCIPNAPGVLKIAPPTKSGQYTLTEIANAMPERFMTTYQMAFIHSLSLVTDQKLAHFTHDEEYMEQAPAVREGFLKEWQAELAEIGRKIRKRNAILGKEKEYTYLDPEQIASGIAI